MEALQQEPVSNKESSEHWPFSFFYFDEERGDSADQVRSAVLVVAALVATASFQAAMSPPDAILDSNRFTNLLFFYSTTLAWSSSMSIIEMLTNAFPFKRELRLSYVAMGIAFATSVSEQANLYQGASYGVFVACCFAPWIIRWVPYLIKKLRHK